MRELASPKNHHNLVEAASVYRVRIACFWLVVTIENRDDTVFTISYCDVRRQGHISLDWASYVHTLIRVSF